MRALHFLTSGVFPMRGGMEVSVLRIARALADSGDCRVTIYTRRQAADCLAPDAAHGPVEAVHLARDKAFLLDPLSGAAATTEGVPSGWLTESLRLDYLLLVNAIRARMHAEPDRRHILISFLMTTNGFVAQHVAFTLDIPHIASVQGSDFSRDFRSPYHLQAVRFVVENARCTVTNNCEQARVLAAAFPVARSFRTVHNALPDEIAIAPWTPTPSSVWRLVADGGFSFKKGTHILLRAVAELHREGNPVFLTLAGGAEAKESAYWEECGRDYRERFPGVFSFPGWLDSDSLDALILSADLYVSASLGEGCSLSHNRAMVLGIPMVATHTGALPELCGDARHVRLCASADVSALGSEIRSTMQSLRAGDSMVDQDLVHRWRRYFSPERERREWAEILAEV
jgi:glycosyltransferase involved in cell wall biosynthesis